MAQPTYVTSGAANATGFSFRVAVQLDFGTSGNVAVLAQAFLEGGSSAGNVNSITVGGTLTGGTTTGSGAGARNKDGTISGGTALTLETEILGASYLGTAGTARAGRIAGLTLTGLQWVQVEAYYLGAPSDGTRPIMLVDVWSGVSAIAAGTGFAASATSGAFSQSVTTTADDVAVALFHTTAPDADTFTATSPTELHLRALVADQVTGINGINVSEPGVAGTTAMVGAFGSATTRPVAGTKWVVQGITAPAGPTLTAPTGVATGTTTATIGATTDTSSGTIYGVVTTSATPPTTTQIAAGQDHTGATAAASGNTGTLTTSGVKTINVTGLTASTTYRAHLYHDDASGDSAVVTSAAFITDITSPSLSAQTASSAAPLTCQGSVSTNEGNGTLYAVVTASATAPSAAQVKAGQDHTGSAALRVISQAVSGTGTQSISSGSVTAGTRYMHFMHEDAAANQSTVVSSASFVVAATFSITTDALEDETGAVLASVTLTRAYAIRLSDHTLVASWASPATNGSGQLVLADAALTAVPHLLATVSNSNADAGAKVYTPG